MNSASILQNLPQWLQATVLVLGVLSTLATAVAGLFALLAKLFPSVGFFDSTAKAIAVVGVDLAAVGSWLGGVVGGKKADAQRGFVRVRALLIVSVASLLMMVAVPLMNGCAWWQGGGESQVVTMSEQIAAYALQGMSIEEIAIKLGIDVAEVLASLLTSLDPKVHATKAYAQARKAQKALVSLPAPDGGQ